MSAASMLLIAAIVFAVSVVVMAIVFGSLLRSLIRQHARERDLLTNQLLHAVGNAWQPPPAAEQKRPVRDVDEQAVLRFTPSPEQLAEA